MAARRYVQAGRTPKPQRNTAADELTLGDLSDSAEFTLGSASPVSKRPSGTRKRKKNTGAAVSKVQCSLGLTLLKTVAPVQLTTLSH